ncbi:hypothetical protein MKZ17_20425 [Solibacillus sp. FSL R7-0682]|uniref:hypothetical protein n=1 Tax=Bacillales TaxID=1385 RepID=UPI0030F8A761
MDGEVFIYLRPIFYLILAFIILNLLILIFIKSKTNNGYIILNSFFLTVLACMVWFQGNIITDEFNLVGDSLYFTLTIVIGIIFIIGAIINITKKRDS